MFVFILYLADFLLSVLQGKVWLIDFNPFGEVTDSLLFTWEELTSENNLRGDFSEGDAQGQVSPTFSVHLPRPDRIGRIWTSKGSRRHSFAGSSFPSEWVYVGSFLPLESRAVLLILVFRALPVSHAHLKEP